MIWDPTPKRHEPADDGAGAKPICCSHHTLTAAEATHRLRLARLAHNADPTVAATATAAICELRQRERLGAPGGG